MVQIISIIKDFKGCKGNQTKWNELINVIYDIFEELLKLSSAAR